MRIDHDVALCRWTIPTCLTALINRGQMPELNN